MTDCRNFKRQGYTKFATYSKQRMMFFGLMHKAAYTGAFLVSSVGLMAASATFVVKVLLTLKFNVLVVKSGKSILLK